MTNPGDRRVLGLSGSLRKESYNTRLLRAAAAIAPGGLSITVADLKSIPLYDEDVRTRGYPPAVRDFRETIAASDGVLIATPEYNYSVPGVLKNAIDWASRPPDQPFAGKPVAIMGASPGRLGSARAQYHLRQVLLAVDAAVLNRPEIMVANAPAMFAEDGALADQATKDLVARLLDALAGALDSRIRQR